MTSRPLLLIPETMQYFDPDAGAALKAAVDDLVTGWEGVTERTMFGCPSYQADGTLFAVVVTGAIALTRLPESARDDLEREYETGPFEAGDRTVPSWTQVDIDEPSVVAALEPFVRASYETALAE